MVLANGKIVNENFELIEADVRVENGKISEIGCSLSDANTIDIKGKYLLPGFIDTHIHGACGVRISDSDVNLNSVTEFEATQGVTALAVTTASSEYDDLLRQLRVTSESAKFCRGAKIAGIHAEGPFISHKYKGAMTEKNIISPDVEKLIEMIEASGNTLKILTIAPEVENAMNIIKFAADSGIVVSMGHTDADYDTAMMAIQAGATRMTHTFNAARPINHRDPGVLAAALTSDDVTCEMICDYVHLHPATIRMIYKLKSADKIAMISDSGHAAGLDVTEFEVDGVMRYVKDGVVRLANGTIAGSAKTLYDGVKNLLRSGVFIEDVSKMASFVPAKSLKIDNETGSIKTGKLADLVVLGENYDVEYTFVNGECVYSKSALTC